MVPEASGAKRSGQDVEDRPAKRPSVHGPETFEKKLNRAKQHSQVWGYVKDRLESPMMEPKTSQEKKAVLQILTLGKLNELDDDFMKSNDRHQRRFNVNMGILLQVVGVEGSCKACPDHKRKNSEQKTRTCVGLPPTLHGPEYQELRDFVDSRCGNCIRSAYKPSSCCFNAGRPVDHFGPVVKVITDTAVKPDLVNDNTAAENRKANPDLALEIVRDMSSVAFHARAQLQPGEQQGFADWVNSTVSFSSRQPNLEGQFLAALARMHELPAEERANVRRWALQFLPGLISRPQ